MPDWTELLEGPIVQLEVCVTEVAGHFQTLPSRPSFLGCFWKHISELEGAHRYLSSDADDVLVKRPTFGVVKTRGYNYLGAEHLKGCPQGLSNRGLIDKRRFEYNSVPHLFALPSFKVDCLF